MSTARFGEPFVSIPFNDIVLGDEVYVGLFLCTHNEDAIEIANFRNVRVIIPAKNDFVPYRDYIGSHLEVMDVDLGFRKILYSEPVSLQAPNWTKDAQSLIYNRNGLLYRFNLQTNIPTVINTGFADRNNNDHVLSWDNKAIGISHHSKDDHGNSVVFTLPLAGGTPKRVTAKSPSYLHGWSPDGKYLIFTGGRSNEYDIYKIPAKGGKEIRITATPGLDDGPEYSPDGRTIYFNSTRSGLMQIWRMNPDGGRLSQITSDEYNNWFPHVSPDGKWIVFLSFNREVAPDDHPFYKQVYIRLIPITGGKPKVIGYVYGGQGTINVPSWSPDSRKIAFVSNSAF
jgi:Tol biopolymer transport system component